MSFARRGAVVALTKSPFDEAVVVTSDDWNDVMHDAAVIPLVRSVEELSLTPPWYVPLTDGRSAVVGRALSLPVDSFGWAAGVLRADDLRRVEEAWIDGLGLPYLLSTPPQRVPAAAGGLYPRWGAVHYADYRVNGERKFYAIVSGDEWNARAPAVTAVRLTSTARGPEFPEVTPGTFACAGNLTSFPVRGIDLKTLPPVRSIDLTRMAKLAAAVAVTHDLGGALGLSDAQLSTLL